MGRKIAENFRKLPNKQMKPILAADSFRLKSGDFQVQSAGAVSSDAAKSADDLVSADKFKNTCFAMQTED